MRMVIVAMACAALASPAFASANASDRRQALVLGRGFPGVDAGFESAVVASLEGRGFEVAVTDGRDLCSRLSSCPRSLGVLVLPNAKSFPVDAKQALLDFIHSDGNVVLFGGPAFSKTVSYRNGSWISRDEVSEARARAANGPAVIDPTDAKTWERNWDDDTRPGAISVEPGPEGAGAAVHMVTKSLGMWDMLMPPPVRAPFAGDASVTAFWAKGGRRTSQIMVEWREKDGSRWTATVDVTPEWRHYGLSPADFRPWPASPDKRAFSPRNAERIHFGLSRSHNALPSGQHEFWIAGISTGTDPLGEIDFTGPAIESVSPECKTFRMESALLEADEGSIGGIFQSKLRGRSTVSCPIWRSRGLGSTGERAYRWAPLATARSRKGGLGAAVAITVFRHGAVAHFGIDDPAFVAANRDVLATAIANAASRLAGDPLLLCAGADNFSAWEDGPAVSLGATVKGPANGASVEFTVVDQSRKAIFEGSAAVGVGEDGLGRALLQCPRLGAGLYTVDSRLAVGGRIVDRISHELRVVAPGPVAARDTVTTHGGEFVLNGSRWRGFGVNYWPLWSAAQEIPDFYYTAWLHPSQYDPRMVERDLSILQKLGMNLVSIMYTLPEHAPALVDFLARCHTHGIRGNIFLAGAHPILNNGSLAVELIRAARLDRNPAVFAYDLGWEVHAGDEAARTAWDSEWRKWVIEQYGSVENAEGDWGYELPAADGTLSGPSDQQLLNDGEWRRMVAAYRRFWDDFICQRYGAMVRMIRSVDPSHMIGVRSGWAGVGSMFAAGGFAYDLASGAMHLDFTSPEYPMPLRARGVSPAGLSTVYGRFASGGKPVYWAEFGATLGPNGGPSALAAQAAYYKQAYRMFEQSRANACAGWWYPGGWRIDEGSDFGLVSPDGTPRPAALVSATGFLSAQTPPPDHYITIDRDLYVSGYASIFAAHKDEYARFTAAGKVVGLRTEGTGTDSSNTPLVAVGNVPCTGSNPPKYLNADLEIVRARASGGRWRLLSDGDTLDATKSLEIRVQAGNNGEARWLAERTGLASGAVYLVARCRGREWKLRIPRNVPPLSGIEITGMIEGIPDGASTLELRMVADGRTPFGRKVTVYLSH